jgi:competence protein ComGC|tara:strand:- start:209 stop:427 length:219 start_codon:yes stop_codon:yes gene_type:complete
VIYIVEPIINLSIKKQSEFQNKDHEKEKLVILNQIKVLELDHDIGNISLNDFKVEKEILKRKVSKLYKELKV